MTRKKKGKTKVTVYPDWCKGCGICVAFCPAKVLELGQDGKAKAVREEDCVNCGFCELHCPDFAVSVEPAETGLTDVSSTDEPVGEGNSPEADEITATQPGQPGRSGKPG